MNVPLPDNLAGALAEAGRFVLIGASDAGKSTLAAHLCRQTGAMLLDGDVGQSEIGPPGMMDIAEADGDRWSVRGQWYVGSNAPFEAAARVVAGAVRLADRAAGLGAKSLVVDTSSFVPTRAGYNLYDPLVEALQPCRVVAVQAADELEHWLAGVGAPVVRVAAHPAVRTKPAPLRAARRATRLAAYFADAKQHSLDLLGIPLRNTRLGFGEAMSPADHRVAARILGCPVVHAERTRSSIAFWTLGMPRRDIAAAEAEFGVRSAVAYDAAFWNGRSIGFIGPSGLCLAMGVVESVDWPSLTASVSVPLHSLAEAVSVQAGLMRHKQNGEGLPGIPERQA